MHIFIATLTQFAGQPLPSGSSQGELHLELWQIINLIGAPVLALMFLQPVIEDLRAWIRARRSQE
jgi:hypothetical protein